MSEHGNRIAPARCTGISGEITYLTGLTRSFTGAQALSFSRSEGVQDGILLGSVLSAAFQLTLDNADGAFTFPHTPYGARVSVFFTEGNDSVPIGVFTVSRVSYSESTGRLTLSGTDAVGTAFEAEWTDELYYPMTLGALAQEIINRVGFTCEDELPNRDYVIYAAPDWGETTVRRALSYVMQAAGCFAMIDGEGALRFLPAWPDEETYTVTADSVFQRTLGDGIFGPLQGISVMPWGSHRDTAPLVVKDTGAVLSGQNCLYLSGNPLFTEDGGTALAQRLFGTVRGMRLTRVQVEWAGDPALTLGCRFLANGRDDTVVSSQVTRQSTTFDQGFSMQTECTVSRSIGTVGQLFTPSGALNASMLQGEVDGKNITAGTVAASALIAGSITAIQLAAASVTAEKLAADVGEMMEAKIGSATIQTAQIANLAATIANIAKAHIGDADIDWASIGNLSAAIADIADAKIGAADIGFAQIKDAVTQNLITKDALADRYYIRKLQVDNLQAIDLTVSNLVVKAADGYYYALDVDGNGAVTATQRTVTAAEIAAGATEDGKRSIIETDLLVQDLSTDSFKATNALIDKLTAGRINVSTLFAREAVIPELEALNISNNQYLRLMVDSKIGAVSLGGRNYLRNSSDLDFAGYTIAGEYDRDSPYIDFGEIDYAELED